ncbi:transcriptional regulator [Lentzea sp. NBRC 105346]|uniref:helix-turn-helix domain-containing protein n=1 Tax=Lentzea sp. NBRC 105346 TaxID=3032205 RepID=UPI0024A26F3C|nr:helix-turn-helix domain-containing protein [Lentzea sp. NBRC 105346]GLZ34830.1 transcriptional regulator [Lentzea sp. NBRC 105346]
MTPADFGEELKRWRLQRKVTQAQTARAVSVSRATIAQWETGTHLPSAENARLLDIHLNAGQKLVVLAEKARGPQRQRAPHMLVAAGEISVQEAFRKVGQALAAELMFDEEGRPAGWRHNLQQKDAPRTALSTAYGIKALLIVGDPHVDLHALEHNLRHMRAGSGGWLRQYQQEPRPEITATVLDALFRIGTPLSVDEALSLMKDSMDGFSRTRPFVLSNVLQTVNRLRPDSPLAASLVEDLLKTRRDFGGVLLWPEKQEPGLAIHMQEPSVVHTARALVALQSSMHTQDNPELQDAVAQATSWLVDQSDDNGVYEELVRSHLTIRHFTSAWVALALASSSPSQVPVERLSAALKVMWSRYDPDLGLWAWGNGDLPIWMTHNAVAALQATAYAHLSSGL